MIAVWLAFPDGKTPLTQSRLAPLLISLPTLWYINSSMRVFGYATLAWENDPATVNDAYSFWPTIGTASVLALFAALAYGWVLLESKDTPFRKLQIA